MKKLSMIVSILLVAVLALGMVGCSTYPSLEKAFENEGYAVVEDVDKYVEGYKQQAEKDDIVLTPHVWAKADGLASTVVIILEFNATEDMKKMYEESDTIKGFISDVSKNDDVKEWQKAMEEAGYAKGNCLVFTINPLSLNAVTNIVKNA